MTVYGGRVEQARELQGLTQTNLAEKVGVQQPAIARIEGGSLQPSAGVLSAIAFHTGFPESFFRQEQTAHFPVGSLQFRARSEMTARQRRQAYQHARTAYEAAERMRSRVNAIPITLARLGESPVEAARVTRSTLSLSPDTPIPHLINVAERAGVVIVSIPLERGFAEGFSAWAGAGGFQVPVITLPSGSPGDRQRWTVAHELGELVLLQPPPGKDREDAADAFAAELLLPEAGLRRELTSPVTLLSLAQLKQRWGVSIQALIMRARDLSVISDRQYRYLFEQLGAKGWRTAEPSNLAIPTERPRAFRKMAELLFGDPIDYSAMARELNLHVLFTRHLVDAHATAHDTRSTRIDGPSGPKVLPLVAPLDVEGSA